MATTTAADGGPAFKMHITSANTGLWHITQTEEAAKKTSELLQEDLEKHHVFFNKDGYHNHIPHHLLALYGTGAGPSSLQKAYDHNAGYQRPALSPHSPSSSPATASIISPHDPWPASASKYFGKEEYYPDFLGFFQAEISRLGWRQVLTQYLWQDDEEMLIRLFGGFLHPLIQLMYGVEWAQEAVIAEALAQAAVHSDNLREFLLSSETRAKEKQATTGKILGLIEEVRRDEKVSKAARNEDGNKIRDGVFKRAKEEMIALAARVRFDGEIKDQGTLDERTAEMFDACVYVASAAALCQPGKVGKYDFFLMHHVNSSPIFVTINEQDWIPLGTKVRLLEWKVRMDLLQYAARGVPALDLDRLTGYAPKKRELGGSCEEIVARLHDLPDDGHAIKLGRAVVICRNISKKYRGSDAFKIQGDGLWEKICHLIVDSVEAPGDRWVRSAGFEGAWEDIPNKEDAKL